MKKFSIPEIKMNAAMTRLYIPIIKADDEISSKFLVYVFDGENFVFDKNAR